MKRYTLRVGTRQGVLFAVLQLLLCLWVQAEMHAFLLPDGRGIEAEVMSHNSRLGLVELKLINGKTVSVKPSIFVEEDQAYIRQWIAQNAFLSERTLRITCDDNVVKKWKEEETRDVRYTSGTIEKDFIHNVIKYVDTRYQFDLKNNGDAVIEGLEIEYCIYYEQSYMVWEEKPPVEQKTFHGRVDVPVISSRGTASVQTKTVMTYEDDVNPIPQLDGDQRRGGKGKIIGIRARIRMKGKDAGAYREITVPKTLSDTKYPWTEATSSNTRKQYRKNRK